MTDPLRRLTVALANRYRIERELGASGMAPAYLAPDLEHHRQMAIKGQGSVPEPKLPS